MTTHAMKPLFERGGLTEELLRSLLDRDLAAGGLVAVRDGKISRTHYAGIIGCTSGALARFRDLFSEYEAKHNVSTGPLRHLSSMRTWLAAEYDAGRLDIRNGKLDRVCFQRQFGLRGGTFLTRHEPIRRLFDEFDERAQREGYMPTAVRLEHERFVDMLNGPLELNKDRLTINQTVLAKAAGIPLMRLRDTGFSTLLAKRQDELTNSVTASRIDPFLHGRVYAFSDLASLWPTAFLEKVGIRFKQVSAGLAGQSVKGNYRALFDCLKWIGASEHEHCVAVVVEAAATRISTDDRWEESLFLYRSHLVSALGGSAADTTITQLRAGLAGLASGGIVPSISIPLPGVKHIHRKSGRLRSVAEVVDRTAGDDYVDFARAQLRTTAKGLGLDLGKDADEFLGGLSADLAVHRSKGMAAAMAVREVLQLRLQALQNQAAAIVDRAMIDHSEGRRRLEIADIDAAAFERSYLDEKLGDHERRRLTTQSFPDPSKVESDRAEVGIANLLALIETRHGAIPPSVATARAAGYGQFFAKRYLAYGGLSAIERMLIPDANTVGAVLTLYLCESGANVSVGRTLERDCFEVSDLKGHHRITGHKARAQGKPIIVDLPGTSPALRAMNWLVDASRPLAVAAKDDGDRLMLMRVGDRVQLMTPHWFTAWFKAFAAGVPGLSDLTLTPNMIRPSVLLHAALSDDGRLGTGMALGQHGLAVTQGYQQKHATRLLYDENIKRFQQAFETLVLSNVEDAATLLGITTVEFEGRLGALRATGLGTFCRDPRGRPGAGTASCTTIDCWNDCPQMLVVAEVEAIAQLRLWQASLRAAQPEWERDRPERWDAVWLPWLCLAEVVQERMLRGQLITVWERAGIRADAIARQPGYLPPRPW